MGLLRSSLSEYLSKYPYAVPIKSKRANEIASHLFRYISLFGPPKELLSDQGTEFLNAVVQHLSLVTGIERRITSPYNPRTNGLTERFNQTLVQSLKKHVESDQHNWPSWLPFILLAYRTRIHSSTGFSPFELIFGRKMNTFENWTDENVSIPDLSNSIYYRSVEIRNLMENTQEDAVRNIARSQVKQKAIQDNRSTILQEAIPNGTLVFIRIPQRTGKLSAKYLGPFSVDGQTPLGNYYLRNSNGQRIMETYPVTRLKLTVGMQSTTSDDQEMYEVEKY